LIGLGLSLCVAPLPGDDARPDFLPFSGTCVPGDKIAVNVDGKLDVCERVNGSYPIGHLDTGIDYESVKRIIVQYQEEILPSCPSCPATRLCGLCYSFLDTQGWIARDAGQCAATVASARRRLVSTFPCSKKPARRSAAPDRHHDPGRTSAVSRLTGRTPCAISVCDRLLPDRGRVDAAIYDLSRRRLWLLDDRPTPRAAAKTPPLPDALPEAQQACLGRLQEAGAGYFDDRPAYVDKLLLLTSQSS
jgi:radical SAM protein with 4Fe4S-binding SPASM domain